MKTMISGIAVLAAAMITGCVSGPSYQDQRPPTDQLVDGNTGLQAKDVGAATDRMATDLLSLPALNAADRKWTIVIEEPNNKTADPYFSHYNVFSDRLKPLLLNRSAGRVSLIENKAAYHAQQNAELETPPGAAIPLGIQPDYSLTMTIDEMPNRATSYFQITASLLNFKTREVVWISMPYEVQTAR